MAGRRLRALSNEALVEAMREGDELAWGEFDRRFRPVLEAFARRVGIPSWEWSSCITDVLDDEALKFARRGTRLPESLDAYLVRAVRNRWLHVKRAALCRERYYASASDAGVVLALCSVDAVRASEGPEAGGVAATLPAGLVRLAKVLHAELSPDEVLLLTWRGAGVPLRQIAAWLGVGYDAAAKRTSRLCQRLRGLARVRAESFSAEERHEVERFFRRVDAPTGTSAVASGALRRRGPYP